MKFERQKAVELFYTEFHHPNYLKDVNDNGHILPKFLNGEIEHFDFSGRMLSHVMAKNLQPFEENWSEYGELV